MADSSAPPPPPYSHHRRRRCCRRRSRSGSRCRAPGPSAAAHFRLHGHFRPSRQPTPSFRARCPPPGPLGLAVPGSAGRSRSCRGASATAAAPASAAAAGAAAPTGARGAGALGLGLEVVRPGLHRLGPPPPPLPKAVAALAPDPGPAQPCSSSSDGAAFRRAALGAAGGVSEPRRPGGSLAGPGPGRPGEGARRKQPMSEAARRAREGARYKWRCPGLALPSPPPAPPSLPPSAAAPAAAAACLPARPPPSACHHRPRPSSAFEVGPALNTWLRGATYRAPSLPAHASRSGGGVPSSPARDFPTRSHTPLSAGETRGAESGLGSGEGRTAPTAASRAPADPAADMAPIAARGRRH